MEPPRPRDVEAEGGSQGSPRVLFALLWDTLTELLGPATTATLVRRSVKHGAVKYPVLRGVIVSREQFDYHYKLPAAWSESSGEGLAAFREMVAELCRLLVPLTGRIVIRRLAKLPEFRRHDVLHMEEGQ